MENLLAQTIKRNSILLRAKRMVQARRMSYVDYRNLMERLPLHRAEFDYDRALSLKDICLELGLDVEIKP